MDRIDPAQYGLIPQTPQEKRKIGKKGKSGSVFDAVLGNRQSEFLDFFRLRQDIPLEELLDTVHSAGEKLKEKPVFSNISAYKKAMGDFLRYIVAHGLEIENVDGARLSIYKKQKKYVIINTINEKLDRLAAGILQNQMQQIDILAKVEEIQGLVVDLLG